MFYLEKNDKPTIIGKFFVPLKRKNNVITINKFYDKGKKWHTRHTWDFEAIAKKINRIILKNSNSKKIVLSKELKKEKEFCEKLKQIGLEISDGNWLFKYLGLKIVDYIIEKRQIERKNLSILVDNLTDVDIYNIKKLVENFKNVNIVTNNFEKFRKIQKQFEKDGIIVPINNNKNKSLARSKLIINVDFSNELINKYNICEDAILLNIKHNVKIDEKRFNGLIINDYEIAYRDDLKDNIAYSGKYYLKDLYEAELYKKQKIEGLMRKFKVDNIQIKQLYTINGSF